MRLRSLARADARDSHVFRINPSAEPKPASLAKYFDRF
jgi:hypothetical protein